MNRFTNQKCIPVAIQKPIFGAIQSPSTLRNTVARRGQVPWSSRQIDFEDEENEESNKENEESSITDVIHEENELNQPYFLREAKREGARTQQKRKAEQMLEGSAKRFMPIPVGQTVRIPIPVVDRAKTDPQIN